MYTVMFALLMILFPIMPTHAAEAATVAVNNTTLSALLITSFLTGIIHTLTGPDHYLPFVAVAKSRGYSLRKTLCWTLICSISHILSTLLIALVFIYFSHRLSTANLYWLNENRTKLAAYLMIGLGSIYLLLGLRCHLLHHYHSHSHDLSAADGQNITIWVLLLIFMFGPCEALLPILAASSVLGTSAVIATTLIFSVVSIVTMMMAVAVVMLGLNVLPGHNLSKYTNEIAGITIMLCGFAILALEL